MSFYEILKIVGSLGFFIYGMKVMSEGIQKVAGNKLRQFLTVMTQNRALGVFTGFLITLIIQSSSATTVMVVSFVNAGLLNLLQALGVIMGANIGTTVTGWLISLVGFKVKISVIALPIIAVAFPMMFSGKNFYKNLAEVLIGFALLFIGLDFLKGALPKIDENSAILDFIGQFSGHGLHYLLFAVFIGTLLTVIVQSSSAAMALTLTMCYQGIIPFEMAAGIVLGENIGTTITANLAALVGNVHAKRAARGHLIFNVFGVIWLICVFPVFIDLVDWIVFQMEGIRVVGVENPDPKVVPIALSVFHTAFNIINVLVMVWFIPVIAKLVEKMVASKTDEDEEFKLEYIGTGLMGTAEISLHEAQKEIGKFAGITRKMSGANQALLLKSKGNQKMQAKLLSKLQKQEDITDQMEIAIASFLAKVSEGELAEGTSLRIHGMLSMINDLERVGDIYYQISKTIERKIEDEIWMNDDQINKVIQMFEVVDEAIVIMMKNLDEDFLNVTITEALDKENEINNLRNTFRREHLRSLESGEVTYAVGMVFNDLIASLEKVGDHIINVTEAITGERPEA